MHEEEPINEEKSGNFTCSECCQCGSVHAGWGTWTGLACNACKLQPSGLFDRSRCT
jgi:hypothetical protein